MHLQNASSRVYSREREKESAVCWNFFSENRTLLDVSPGMEVSGKRVFVRFVVGSADRSGRGEAEHCLLEEGHRHWEDWCLDSQVQSFREKMS